MSEIGKPRILSVLDSKRYSLWSANIGEVHIGRRNIFSWKYIFLDILFPRSNQINIGLKCLPPVLSLREAILAMNDSRISRDGLEKLQALFHLFLYSNKLTFFWKVFLPFLLALSQINQNHQALAPTQEELTAIRSAVAEVKILENSVLENQEKKEINL